MSAVTHDKLNPEYPLAAFERVWPVEQVCYYRQLEDDAVSDEEVGRVHHANLAPPHVRVLHRERSDNFPQAY